jgi:DNA-binding MarR family transcriptional regulator
VTAPDLAMLTHRLALLTRRAMHDRMAAETWALEAGFRQGCIGVLRAVAYGGSVSQREVSDQLLLDPSDVVTLVDILERAGLLTRERDPADRRRHALTVTVEGKLAVCRLDEVARDAGESVLAPLDEDERKQLGHLLHRIVSHHAGAEPARPPAGS